MEERRHTHAHSDRGTHELMLLKIFLEPACIFSPQLSLSLFSQDWKKMASRLDWDSPLFSTPPCLPSPPPLHLGGGTRDRERKRCGRVSSGMPELWAACWRRKGEDGPVALYERKVKGLLCSSKIKENSIKSLCINHIDARKMCAAGISLISLFFPSVP